jgi:hypothetical protein
MRCEESAQQVSGFGRRDHESWYNPYDHTSKRSMDCSGFVDFSGCREQNLLEDFTQRREGFGDNPNLWSALESRKERSWVHFP